jgi:DNA repair protein RadA/Sms
VKTKTVYACQQCGAQSPKWLGRCPECEAWNSFVEERPVPAIAGGGAAAASAGARYALAATAGPQLYEEIDSVVSPRLSTNSTASWAAASCRARSS